MNLQHLIWDLASFLVGDGTALPFEAVFKTGTESIAMRAGEHGTFVFELDAFVRRDELHTHP